MNRISEIKERSKTDVHTEQTWDDIAYLLRIAEAAEVMREALEKYEEPSNWYSDSSLENGVVYVTEVWKCAGFGNQTAQIALAKAKELMGE